MAAIVSCRFFSCSNSYSLQRWVYWIGSDWISGTASDSVAGSIFSLATLSSGNTESCSVRGLIMGLSPFHFLGSKSTNIDWNMTYKSHSRRLHSRNAAHLARLSCWKSAPTFRATNIEMVRNTTPGHPHRRQRSRRLWSFTLIIYFVLWGFNNHQ